MEERTELLKLVNDVCGQHEGVFRVRGCAGRKATEATAVLGMVPTELKACQHVLPKVILDRFGELEGAGRRARDARAGQIAALREILATAIKAQLFRRLPANIETECPLVA